MLLLPTLHSSAQSQSLGLIVDGDPVDISEIPFMVSLMNVNQTQCASKHICGGIILTDEWVLTAAHCTCNQNLANLYIQSGATNVNSSDGQTVKVVEVVEHPSFQFCGFDSAINQYDFALLRLEEALCFNENVQPALIDHPFHNSSITQGSATAAGWGVQQNMDCEVGPSFLACQDLLLKADGNISTSPLCPNDPYPNGFIYVSKAFGFVNSGDSGGPLYIDYNNVSVPIGVTSNGCCNQLFNSSDPNEFIDIWITKFATIRLHYDWISQIIHDRSELKTECDCDFPDLVVHDNVNLSFGKYNSITVKNGATLQCTNGEIQITGEIIVEKNAKLIIDDATLTSCDPALKWQGIIVDADWNQNIGEVYVKNNAIIENAVVGIDNRSLIPLVVIPVTVEYGGALVEVNNATIRNCDIGIRMSLNFFDETSSIQNSTIESCDVALSLYQSNKMNIQNSLFIDNQTAIDGISSSVVAESSTFNSDVYMTSNWPQASASFFKENTFLEMYATFHTASNSEELLFFNNQFFDSGFTALGEMFLKIENNDYIGSETGNYFWNTGENIQNLIQNNDFSGVEYGNTNTGDNDTEFWYNCFDATVEADIEVYHLASIHHSQGEEEEAAANCFSFAGKIKTGIGTEEFDYWSKDGILPATNICKHPGTGNFDLKQANDEFGSNCGSSLPGVPGTGPNRYLACKCWDRHDCETMRQYILNQIAILEENTTMNPYVREWAIRSWRRCLDKNLRRSVRIEIEDENDRQAAIDLLQAQPEFRYNNMAYGMMMDEHNYPAAKSYLNSLLGLIPAEQEYVASQNILHEYLMSSMNPSSVTQQQLTVLYQNGSSFNTLSGFSRSIYRYITGDTIHIHLPHLEKELQPTSKKNHTERLPQVKIYPNPLMEDVFMVAIDDFNPEYSYELTAYDFTGTLVMTQRVNTPLSRVNFTLPSGMYIIHLTAEGHTLATEKLVKTK
jgi:hypothetical protein